MMWRMVLRRIGIGIVTLWVVSVLMFAGTEILPGDVAQIMLGQEATPENLAALREALGLNKPAWLRYFEWLGDMARFDLGMSLAGTTGSGGGGTTIDVLIGDRLQNTLLLAGIVAAISVPLSVALGLTAAMFPTSPFDRIVTFTTLCLVAVPEFFVATLLVLILAVQLNWLPANRDDARVRVGRPDAAVDGAAGPDAVRGAARPDGAHDPRRGAQRHELALHRDGDPQGRAAAAHHPAPCPVQRHRAGGQHHRAQPRLPRERVVIVETIFAFPGLAKLMVDGVQVRDMPLVQACGMIFCGTYVVLILISDIASIVSNPRLRHPR